MHKKISKPDLKSEVDTKMLAIMNTYEKQKEKIENENRALKREIDNLKASIAKNGGTSSSKQILS